MININSKKMLLALLISSVIVSTSVNAASDNVAKTYTNKKATETLSTANNYTDQKVTFLNNRINQVEKLASAGIAGAMAMANTPTQAGYDHNYGMAVSSYSGEGAIATNVTYLYSDNSIISLSASYDTAQNVGLGAGISFGF